MIDNGATFDDLLERAWAKSITKPRAISKKSSKARRKKTWTGMTKVRLSGRSRAHCLAPEMHGYCFIAVGMVLSLLESDVSVECLGLCSCHSRRVVTL